MKTGYTLIEFSLSIFLISLLLFVLLQCLDQFNKTLSITHEITDTDITSAMIQHQLEKDLSGAFIPIPFPTQPEEKTPISQEKNVNTNQKTKKEKPIERIFYCGMDKNNTYLLTFISSNPIRVYDKAKNSRINPKIVRIVYRLEPDKEHKNLFKLVRYESEKLNFAPFSQKNSPVKGHILATRIKKVQSELYYVKEKKNGEMPVVKIWNSDTALQQDMPLIPQAIRITFTLSISKDGERDVIILVQLAGEAIPEQAHTKKPSLTEEKKATNIQEKKKSEKDTAHTMKEKVTITHNKQQKPLTPLQQLRATLKNNDTKYAT